jgi:SAM-dependent methyltransferase
MPILPLLYRLNGVRCVHLTDLRPLLNLKATEAAVRELQTLAESGAIPASDPTSLSPTRIARYSELNELLHLRYDPKFDLRRPRIRHNSLDLVFSRTVLEHIPERALPGIHRGLFRLLKPGAVAIHTIDCSDHFEHFDKSIPRLNFLRYSPLAWRFINNGILYQNRLRASDHVRLLCNAGFEILRVEGQPNARALAELARIPLHADFQRHTPEDLATITVHVIARRPR